MANLFVYVIMAMICPYCDGNGLEDRGKSPNGGKLVVMEVMEGGEKFHYDDIDHEYYCPDCGSSVYIIK